MPFPMTVPPAFSLKTSLRDISWPYLSKTCGLKLGYLTMAWQGPAACWVCGALTADQSSAHMYCMSHRLMALGRNLCCTEREGYRIWNGKSCRVNSAGKVPTELPHVFTKTVRWKKPDIISHADHKCKCQTWLQSEQEGLVTVSLFDPLEQLSASRRGWLVTPSALGPRHAPHIFTFRSIQLSLQQLYAWNSSLKGLWEGRKKSYK